MKSLITGCAGFIGSSSGQKNCCERGHEVIGIDCFTDYYPRTDQRKQYKNALGNKKFTFNRRGPGGHAEFPEVDYVFPRLAQAGVRSSWVRDFKYTPDITFFGDPRNSGIFIKTQSQGSFVYASSSSIYGNVTETGLSAKRHLKIPFPLMV